MFILSSCFTSCKARFIYDAAVRAHFRLIFHKSVSRKGPRLHLLKFREFNYYLYLNNIDLSSSMYSRIHNSNAKGG